MEENKILMEEIVQKLVEEKDELELTKENKNNTESELYSRIVELETIIEQQHQEKLKVSLLLLISLIFHITTNDFRWLLTLRYS